MLKKKIFMAALHFYYAAMNAGKSTYLLQTHFNYNERGMKTLLFSPAIDTRSGSGQITSRIGIHAPSILFDETFHFLRFIEQTCKQETVHAVLIDEAQFLKEKQVMQLTDVVDKWGMPVLTYGLKTDFRGRLFEGSKALLEWAEHLREIKNVCQCGKKAILTARLNAQGQALQEGEQIQIGGNEQYQTFCRKHYKALFPSHAWHF